MSKPESHGLIGAYHSKPAEYFVGGRKDFITLLPRSTTSKILEIGCGSGATGALAAAEQKCATYVGVELMPEPALIAREFLDEVIVGDVEQMHLPFEHDFFDVLILSEVLEHLVDPWATLTKLGAFLKPGAIVLASSPNIGHWKVIRQIARGDFEYKERGVMDRTHLRWFTKRSYRKLFEATGYRVDEIWPIVPLTPAQRIASALLFGRSDYFMSQICLRGTWLGHRKN